jgi:polyhydroxyalkanoate synthase
MNPWTGWIDAYTEGLEAGSKLMQMPQRMREAYEISRDIDDGATDHGDLSSHPDYDLLHYKPHAEKEEDVPILLNYSLINRSYVMDLEEDRSIVQSLLDEGHDVYMMDWNDPGIAGSELTLDDYVNRYMDDAVDTVREHSGEDRVNLLGYCMGGTMAAMYAANHPDKLNTLGMMASVTHCDGTAGELEEWLEEYDLDPSQVTDTFGTMPDWFLSQGFAAMEPVHNTVGDYAQAWDNMDDEEAFGFWALMQHWKNNGVDVAGPAYEQFVEDIYRDNKLIRDEMELMGEPVDLEEIDMPVLQIVGEYDPLVPPESSTPFNDAVASEGTAVISHPTGHIGLAVSGSSHRDLWPDVADWLAERS